MNCLELDVEEACLDQCWQAGLALVHEAFESIQAAIEFRNRRWHKQRVAWVRAADPILRTAEFAGTLGDAPAALQQAFVHLSDETERQRQFFQPFEPVHHGVDVVRDLSDIIDGLAGLRLGFEAKQVRQGRLRALDLRGQDRFLSHVHVKKSSWRGRSMVMPSRRPNARSARLRRSRRPSTSMGGAGGSGGGTKARTTSPAT